MQNAINMVPSIPHSEKKKFKRTFLFLKCGSQNFADVEVRNLKTAHQKLFKENLCTLIFLFHLQITDL